MASRSTSELRLPAAPEFIVVAKRAAAAFASVAGFDVEATEDLTIAVAQACENAISCAGSAGSGQIRLLFRLEEQRVVVQVRSVCGRADIAATAAPAAGPRAREQAFERVEAEAATDLALRLMGLFVDDFGYQVDERTGGLRVRLTKYRVS